MSFWSAATICFGGVDKSTISCNVPTLGGVSEMNFSGLVRRFIEAAAGSKKARKASTERFLSGRQPSNSRLKFDMAVVI